MSILWIIAIVAIVIVAAFFFLRFQHFKKKGFLILGVVIILILVIGYFAVIANKGVDITKPEGIGTALKLYVGWFATLFHNMKVITGQAIHMDWTSTDVNTTDKVIAKVQSTTSGVSVSSSGVKQVQPEVKSLRQ